MDDTGRVVAVHPGIPLDDSEAQEAAIRVEMWKESSTHHSVMAIGVIEPARQQVLLEHNIRVQDLLRIIQNRPFVPPGRELIYARGLHAGITGDYLIALHLLVPQVENSIRYLLKRHGAITTGLTAEGIQQEHDLGTLLFRFAEELESILDSDTVFDLQGFFVSPFGLNLRNLLAHGLLDHSAFISLPAVYGWWLTLHLCLGLSFVEDSSDPGVS